MRFQDIPATDRIREKLIQTVTDQRVSHAQLFYGPEGSGKLALAIAYAQLINCKEPAKTATAIDSCGVCPSCIQYQKLVHPDLHFIFPNNTTKKVTSKPCSSNFISEWRAFLLENNYNVTLNGWFETLGIENKQGTINVRDAEEIIHKLSYKSYESEYKVMIIWMVEKLYHVAAPKLLKILEEPPDKTLFLLISEDHDQVLPTIASRCLPVRIPRLVTSGDDNPEESQFNHNTFRQWMLDCHQRKIVKLVEFSSDVSKIGRERQKSLLHYGLGTAKACLGYKYTGVLPDGTPEEQQFVAKLSKLFNPDNLPVFAEMLNQSIYHIERNAHAPTLFLDLSMKMVQFFTGPAGKPGK